MIHIPYSIRRYGGPPKGFKYASAAAEYGKAVKLGHGVAIVRGAEGDEHERVEDTGGHWSHREGGEVRAMKRRSLRTAREKIREGMSIEQAAKESMFGNVSKFKRNFRDYFGYEPEELQRKRAYIHHGEGP